MSSIEVSFLLWSDALPGIITEISNTSLSPMLRSSRKFMSNITLHGVIAVLVLLAALLAESLSSS